jgi:hypothetical protein
MMVPEWQVANVYICLLVAVAAGKLLSYLRKQDCRSPRAQVQREDPAGPSIESLFQLIYTSDLRAPMRASHGHSSIYEIK